MNIYSNEIIKHNPKLKHSFFQLAKQTFQLQFEEWDALGYWNDSYTVHCIEQNDEIISNVSTSDALLVIDGNPFRAKQIGTVMTAPHARRSGYATTLMEHVLKKHEQLDYLFLFANPQAATFYEQFEFQLVKQKRYSINTSHIQFKPSEIKKLDFDNEKTRALLLDLLIHRLPVSTKLGVLQNEMIVLFHLMSTWREHLYYLPTLQTVVIGQQQGTKFILVDYISKQPILLKELLPYLKVTGDLIKFLFTPSTMNGMESVTVENDYFYVKNQCDTPFPADYYFPDIAKA